MKRLVARATKEGRLRPSADGPRNRVPQGLGPDRGEVAGNRAGDCREGLTRPASLEAEGTKNNRRACESLFEVLRATVE